MTQEYTRAQVAQHNNEKDAWIIVDSGVYDVTKFLDLHPGGKTVLAEYAGKDATTVFYSLHSKAILQRYQKRLLIGQLSKSDQKAEAKREDGEFGELIPYGDPYWYGNLTSPYYKETHRKFRSVVRNFVETELMPYLNSWNESGTYPHELHQKAYKAGILGAVWPKEWGGTPPEDFDAFHDLIMYDELARCADGGILMAIFFSFGISLPPVLRWGSDYLKERVCRGVITGEKIMSLAVTEPYGGSDVRSMRTTARREGDFFIVNGEKKFITSGIKADFFTVAVRTGGPGIDGISLLLMENDMPGLKKRRQKTQGWWISNTTYLSFENVRVPVRNLIGKEGQGFKYIMYNFNHERWGLAVMANRFSRVCIEESIKYARLRKTFGKRLIDHQVIRHKIGEMSRQVEATHAWIEQITHQMARGAPDGKLGGPIALLKVQATKTFEFCAREASQIFGGASYQRGGIGEKVERLYREVRVSAIGGGSEEILLDLAARQAKL